MERRQGDINLPVWLTLKFFNFSQNNFQIRISKVMLSKIAINIEEYVYFIQPFTLNRNQLSWKYEISCFLKKYSFYLCKTDIADISLKEVLRKVQAFADADVNFNHFISGTNFRDCLCMSSSFHMFAFKDFMAEA